VIPRVVEGDAGDFLCDGTILPRPHERDDYVVAADLYPAQGNCRVMIRISLQEIVRFAGFGRGEAIWAIFRGSRFCRGRN